MYVNMFFFLSNHSFGMAHSFVDSIGDVDVISDAEVNNIMPILYSATTRTGPLGPKLTNQNVN